MKAVVITQHGPADVLQIQERPVPTISPDEVLIKVHAAGINRPDILQRMGKYPAPTGVVEDIPGLEVSGEVIKVGENVASIQLGDRVMALVAGGGNAEYVSVNEGICVPMPKYLNFVEAAAMPETLYTVWHNLFQRGKLASGERVLIHGGAGGIGSTAIILAKLFRAHVITTIRGTKKYAFVTRLGADEIIDYTEQDFSSFLKNNKVDIILDYIGGEYFEKNIDSLKEEGRLVYINAMNGGKVPLNIFKIMQKRLTITGSTLRNRELSFKRKLSNEISSHLLPLMAKHKIKLPIYKVLHYTQASEAHRLLEESEVLGKVVLVF